MILSQGSHINEGPPPPAPLALVVQFVSFYTLLTPSNIRELPLVPQREHRELEVLNNLTHQPEALMQSVMVHMLIVQNLSLISSLIFVISHSLTTPFYFLLLPSPNTT